MSLNTWPPQRRRDRLKRSLHGVIAFLAMLLPTYVPAWVPTPIVNGEVISFDEGSSIPSDAERIRIASHLPLINAIYLDVIVVVAYYELNSEGQSAMALARAESIKQFLMEIGVPSTRVYTETKALKSIKSLAPSTRPKPGSVEFEYAGQCINSTACEQECPGGKCKGLDQR